MRRVIWSDTATTDFHDILHHIATADPDAADRVADAIEASGAALGDFATGHPGRVAGTFEKLVRRLPYIITYALTDDERTVSILRLIHAARDWQDESWPE
ncbi:type II toxin-antitoxin system RelE/ParE family toxin [Novosphingobium sp.]|uniref:type II toxin-antitoxin system RelE/ParE family toxin n=1 Tax=Novosphingobium sp. TaxID=1874826 RepID=UPI003B515BAD